MSKTEATLARLRKQAKRRNKKRGNDPTAAFDYQNLEPRQLLAADILGMNLLNDTGFSPSDNITNDASMVNVQFDNVTVIPSAGEQILVTGPGPASTLYGISAPLTALDIAAGNVNVTLNQNGGLPEAVTTITAKSSSTTVNVGSEDSLTVTLDITAPNLLSAAYDDTLITDADTVGTINLQFTFDEAMDTTPVPPGFTITDPTGGTILTPANSFGFISPTVYQLNYSLADTGHEQADITVSQGNGVVPRDLAGNPLVPVTSISTGTAIDTLNPTVTITSDDGTGGGVINGTETAELTFTFNEPLQPGSFTSGDVSFSNGGSIGALTQMSPTVYKATYTPVSGIMGTDTVSIAVGAFNDAAGNPNDVGDSLALSVDTIKPTVVSALFDISPLIKDADVVAPGVVTLTIEFDEPMDPSMAPGISFPDPEAVATLTSPAGGAWFAGNTKYGVTYTLADANVELDDITVDVSVAKDAAGNVMDPTSESSGTGIDTLTELVTFTINDSMPQEDVLPDTTLINAEVTFMVDDEAQGDTTITYMIGGGASDTATAGPTIDSGFDYRVDPLDAPGVIYDDTTGPTPFYMGSITIPEGELTAKLDIDMWPDLIWEGDETFTVKIVSVTNTEEMVMDGSTPATVTIKDNETGAEVSIMATDDKASEAFQFEAVDLNGDSLFDSDIIVNTDDLIQDPFDTGTHDVYVTDGGLVTTGPTGDNGLNDFGFFAETPGVHPNVQLTFSDSDDGDNARVTPFGIDNDVFNLDVPNGQYSEIHLFGAAVGGNAAVSVRFYYDNGTFATPSQSFGDWTSAASADTYVLTGSNDRAENDADSSVDSNDAAIFGSVFNADPNRTLEYIEISVNTSDDAENFFNGGAFAFFGATGVAAEGTMAEYTVKLDVALDHDLTVELTASGVAGLGNFGDPADGINDYYLSVESVPGSGNFDTNLPVISGNKVNVVIPAGLTERAIKLTAKDDMVIEGGIVDSFGSEDAILTITGRTPDAGPTPDVGADDSATAEICDDDQGQVNIEYIAPGSGMVAEGGDSGKIKVSLTKKNTTVEGDTTSSSDTLIMVDVGGVADPGDDYRTTITSTEGSFSNPQRVDGFWSKQNDPLIGQPDWAHNSVNAVATGGSKHYYEVVLYQDGRLLVDVDNTNGFDSHIRIFNGSQASAGQDAARGGSNNNGGDPGSVGTPIDARRQTGILPAGRYIIEVSRHAGPDDSPAQAGRTANLQNGDAYLLNISIENFDEGILIPAGQSMTMFNVDPIDDMIVEGGYVSTPPGSFGSESVVYTMTGFKRTDPDIMIGPDNSADLDIKDNDEAEFGVTSTMNGHEDPLTTPPGVPQDGKFTVTLSKESSTDTKVKFTILGYNDAADYPGMGVEQLSDDATYGVDYTLSTSGDPADFQFFTGGPNEGMGFITVPAGQTSVDIIVNVINEDFIEDDEFVRLEFATTSPPNMNDPEITVDGTEAVVTIFDEDLSEVAINGAAYAEEGGQNGLFTVSLDNPKLSDTHTEVEFMVMTADTLPAANLPGDTPFDYSIPFDPTGLTSDVLDFDPATGKGVVRIPAHKPLGEIVVVANDDMLIELTEYIKITLVDDQGDPLGPIVGDSNIVDIKPGFEMDEIELRDNDEAFVKVERIQDGKEPGGPEDPGPGADPGGTDGQDGQFKVSLVKADGSPATAEYDIEVSYSVGGTADPGAAPDGINNDYRTLPGTVTIPAGPMGMAPIWVDVFDDVVNESDQTVEIQLTGTDSNQIDLDAMDEASLVIIDDDSVVVSITANDSMAREASDDGQYTLFLDTPSDNPIVVTIDVVTGNGPNPDATEGSDYVLSTKTVTFAPFQMMATVDLDVRNDAELEEYIEQAEVIVSSIVSANHSSMPECSEVTASPDSAIVDIKPDPTVSVRAHEMMGTEGGDTDPSFIVELPTISGGPLNGQYNLADGDLTVEYTVYIGDPVLYGTPDADYVALTGTVVIPQSDGFAKIDVEILEDMIIEGEEYVSVMLKEVIADDVNDSDVEVRRDLYSIDRGNPVLRIVNTDVSDSTPDGATDKVVPITLVDGREVFGGHGVAVDPTTWEVYVVLNLDGVPGSASRELATIDPATGVATAIGDLGDRFSDIAFGPDGTLYGVTGPGATVSDSLFVIDKTDASTVLLTSSIGAGGSQSIDFNPIDSNLLHSYSGPQLETLGLPGGTPATALPITGDPTTNLILGLEHAERGNFAGNSFFQAGNDLGTFTNILNRITITPTISGDVADVSFVGIMDGGELEASQGLAFVKSTDFVKIKDNDSGFIEVKAKPKGFDNLDDTVDTGFNITIKKYVDGEANDPTTSSTDTTVEFMVMDSATPFLGAQTEDSSSDTGQDIDTYPGGPDGGALNWSFNGAGIPHTIVNGVSDSASDTDIYTFTVLNDGDAIDISAAGPVALMQLDKVGGGTVAIGGGSISLPGGVAAGTYKLTVVTSAVGSYSLDVAVENHLIADYELTSDAANDLTFLGSGLWQATIPAGEESIMVNVEVYNDTQVEGDEEVSLWMKTVAAGDPQINTGFIYFADNTDGGGGGNDGIGRVDVGGAGLVKLINTDSVVPGDSDPFGVAIDDAEGKIYWTDADPNVEGIYRANLDGTDPERVIDTGFDPRGLQVVGDYVYWVDEETAELHRALKDGSGTTEDVLDLPSTISDLDDLGVDSVNNKVYWVDDGLNRISRANLDGTLIETLIQFTPNPSTELVPQSIALDVDNGKMYWTNAFDNIIQRANLDGTNIETVASANSDFPNGIELDLMNQYVYWADNSGTNSLRRAFYGGTLGLGNPVETISVVDLPGTQNLQHLDLVIPTMIHATAIICDTDTAEVYVSSDNTLAEASVDPASEPNTHKDIVVGLRDPNGNPVTSQTSTLVDYLYNKPESTASNGLDHYLLDGDVLIPAGQSSAVLEHTKFDSTQATPSVFVLNDSLLEGNETVVIGLDAVAAGDGEISIVAPNADMEDIGTVLILDDESTEVHFGTKDGDTIDGKERDGSDDEPLSPGKFTLRLGTASATDTTVTFMVDPLLTDAESNDYSLSTMNPANDLQDLGGGMWSIKILANEKSVMINVDIVDDDVVELDEVVTFKITEVVSDSGANITFDANDRASVTIFDDDVAKVIVTNDADAVESTQPGVSPGTSGRFKISLVDPRTEMGEPLVFVESETTTTVKVLLNEDIPNAASFTVTPNVANSGDYNIVEIITPPDYNPADPDASPRYAIIEFAPGVTMQFLDVNLVEETPPLDMGDEFVMLTLDPTYGIPTDGRVDDGVVGDAQILLDKKPGGVVVGDEPHVIFVVDISGSTGANFGGTPVGDVNGDGFFDTVLDAQLAGLIALNESFAASGDPITISVVPFESNASTLDMDPVAANLQISTAAGADAQPNSVLDVEEVLVSLLDGGGTNFVDAMDEARGIFGALGTAPANANVIFLSDGSSGNSLTAIQAAADLLQGVADNVQAFGMGAGASLTQLDIVDTDDAVLITDVEDLLTEFGLSSGSGGGGGGGELVYEFGHPDCPPLVLDGMGMNMATVTIFDEQFKININANDENASEPGTLPLNPGDNGQFTVSISNPWQFGDTIVNYKVTGTATPGVDYSNLPGYDPSNPDFVSFDGQVVIPLGAGSVPLDVLVIDDEIIEMDPETVTVMLTGLDNESTTAVENVSSVGVRMLGSALTDTVNIFDDDGAVVTPNASDPNAREPNSPADNGQFEVTLLEGNTPITSDAATTVKFQMGGDARLGGSGAVDFGGADYKLALDSSTDGTEGFSLTYDASTGMGFVTIPAGFSTAKINVVTLNDYILEDDETVELTAVAITAGNPNIGVSGSTATVTIEDTDVGELVFETLDDTGREPGGLNPDAKYRVYLVQAGTNQRLVSDTATTVSYEVKPDSDATAGDDYVALSGTVVIPAFTGLVPSFALGGDGESLIGVDVLDDFIVEPTETVIAGSTAVSGDADISLHPTLNMGTVFIEDNDGALVSIKSDSTNADDDVREGDPTVPNPGKFEVLMDAESATDTVVTFMVVTDASTTNPNATYGPGVGGDYTLSGVTSVTFNPLTIMGTVTIPAGHTSAIIDLTTTNDLIQEGLEDVTVKVVSTDNGDIGVDGTMDRATITIEDDDFPTFIVNSTMANEEEGKITFTIDLTDPIDVDVEVFLTLTDGTATGISGSTFDPESETEDYNSDNTVIVTFPANGGVTGTDLSRTIMIDINDDIWVEKDENFFAELVVQGASLPNALPDGRPINILDAKDPGFGEAIIKNNADVAVFTIGAINNDFVDDYDPTNWTFNDNGGSGTVDVSGAPGSISITSSDDLGVSGFRDTDLTVVASEDGMVSFDWSYSSANGSAVWDPFGYVLNGTFVQLTDDGGGVAQSGSVSFLVQDGDTFGFRANSLDSDFGSATTTITNFSAPVDPSVIEGTNSDPYDDESPTTPVDMFVYLSNPISADVDVDVSFGGGTATGGAFEVDGGGLLDGTASFGTDYRNITQTVEFEYGEYGAAFGMPITVPVIQDQIVEGGPTLTPGFETFIASLTPDAGQLMGRPSVSSDTTTASIVDDDSAKVSVMTGEPLSDPYEASEDGHTPDFGDGKYTISLDNPSGSDTVVKFQMSGDADLGADYTLSAPAANMLTDLGSGMFTVKIPAGDTNVMVTLEAVSEPALIEDDEFAIMTLVELQSDPDADIMIDDTKDEATVRINDGDPGKVKITADPNMAFEGGSDGKFTFNLIDDDGDAVSDSDTVVKFTIATGAGNATPGVDYFLTGADLVSIDYSLPNPMGTVLIPAGESTAMISVEAVNDLTTEGDETVTLTVSDITEGNADIQPDDVMPTDTVTIKDDGDGLFVKVEKAEDGDGAETNTSDDDNGLFRVFLVDANGTEVNLPAVDGGKIRVQFSVGVDDDPLTPDAIESEDYQVTDFEVEIQSGSSQNFVEIFVLDDLIAEPLEETLKFTLTDIQDANAVSITTLSTGEEIDIDPDCMMDTMVILDDDAAPEVGGVYANSDDWSANFRDNVSGAPGLGFELVSGTGDTMPWTNVGQFIVTMDQPVDYTSVQLSDFALSGTPGSVPSSIGPAIIPTIDSWAPGASANEIVLTLSDDLMAAELKLDILGSGILNTGGVSYSDVSIEFLALPGDAGNDMLFVLPNDVSRVAGEVVSVLGVGTYDFRSDLDGDGFILPNDFSMAAEMLFSNLVVTSLTAANSAGDSSSAPDTGAALQLAPFDGGSSINGETQVDSSPQKAARMNGSKMDTRASLTGASGTVSDEGARDAAFEDLFSDKSKKSAEVADGDLKIDLSLF